MKKKVCIYGNSAFMTGLKLSMKNIEEFSVETIENPLEFENIITADTVLIIEKSIFNSNYNDIKGNVNNGTIAELILQYPDLKIVCLDPDNEDACFIKSNIHSVKNKDDLIKEIILMD